MHVRHISRLVALSIVFALVGLGGCTGSSSSGTPTPRGGGRGTIVVGVSGAFAENQIVAELYAQVLERAGYTVDRQFDLRSREVSQSALESGQIDVKPEYLSSLLLFLDPNGRVSGDPAAVARQDSELLRGRAITLLTPSPAQDKNQFVANAQTAKRFGLTTMSSLAPVAGQVTFGGPPECPQRPFCIQGLHRVYGIIFDDFKALDVGGPQTVAALRDDSVQVGLLFSTDPSIKRNGFVPLADDRHLQNAENITPVIRSDKVDADVRRALDSVSAVLTTQNVTTLVGSVVIDGQSVAAAARAFLIAEGLL